MDSIELYRILGFALSLVGLTIALVKYVNKVREDGSKANASIYKKLDDETKTIYDYIEKKADGIGSRIDSQTEKINKIEVAIGKINQIDNDQEKQIGTLRDDIRSLTEKVSDKLDDINNEIRNLAEQVALLKKID